jgi:hypothetical protein
MGIGCGVQELAEEVERLRSEHEVQLQHAKQREASLRKVRCRFGRQAGLALSSTFVRCSGMALGLGDVYFGPSYTRVWAAAGA